MMCLCTEQQAGQLPQRTAESGAVAERPRKALGWIGNVRYLASEIIGHGSIPPSGDICGLGAILYQLLTGRPTFDGGSLFGLIARVLHEPPTLLALLRPEVPDAIEGLCLSGLLEREMQS